jgi:dipeptidyl aminopeptidase/acylaminoacyl peptidase
VASHDTPARLLGRYPPRVDADLRETDAYREVETFFRRMLEPGFGRISNPSDPRLSPDGRLVAFRGEVLERLEGHPAGRVCLVPSAGGEVLTLTDGPDDDQPRWSPADGTLTFRSDRGDPGRHALFALDPARPATIRTLPALPGIVEHHTWSPDGTRILALVAGAEAERSDAAGSGTVGGRGDVPDWLPEVESSQPTDATRRSLHVIEPATGSVARRSPAALNVWEAAWCGTRDLAAIVSEEADESAWYGARLSLLGAVAEERVLLRSDVQLGWVTAAPGGGCIAVVEALSSDRLVVAGDLLLLDPAGGEPRRVETHGVDVGWLAWETDARLLAVGVRGLDSVVLDVDPATGSAAERWSSPAFAGASLFLGGTLAGDAALLPLQSAHRPPALVSVRGREETTLVSGDHPGTDAMRATVAERRRPAWTAPDGLEIEGLLTLPVGEPPFPTILSVHGGPVWGFQDFWPSVSRALLHDRGYAFLEPNPRGSWGRGRGFAEAVVGDMGGADALDLLAGLDHVIASGLADPQRLGVMGGSYGGFMACWLPVLDRRFAAAVAASPVTDWFSERYESNLGSWATSFLGGDVGDRFAHYRERSPVFSAGRVGTPTLLTAGARDRATPAGQAVEFHRALRDLGVPTDVVRYPLEGHGVRDLPAAIDFATRVCSWFERFMPAGADPRRGG